MSFAAANTSGRPRVSGVVQSMPPIPWLAVPNASGRYAANTRLPALSPQVNSGQQQRQKSDDQKDGDSLHAPEISGGTGKIEAQRQAKE